MIRGTLLALLLAACGGGGSKPAQPALENTTPTPPPDAAPMSDVDSALARMAQFETAICACADGTCVQKVADEMAVWAKELENEHKEPTHMDDAQTQRATEIGQHMGECMQKAMAASPPPGAGSSTP